MLGGNWWVGLSTGTGFTVSYWGIWAPSVEWKDVDVGDFDGDGRDDIVGQTSGNWWIAVSNGNSFINSFWAGWSSSVDWKDVRVGDYNGDGRDDIVGRAGGAWWMGLSNGISFSTSLATIWPDITWVDVLVGDFNGDGRDDIAGRADGVWNVGVSNGAVFSTENWGAWSNAVTWNNVQVADVDNDGKDDILGRAGNSIWTAYGRTNFTSALWAIWPNASWSDVTKGDFDGDGRDDLSGQGNSSLYMTYRAGNPRYVSIVDNSDTANFTKSGGWNLLSSTASYIGSYYSSTLPSDGSETATWTFNVAPGTYRISAAWNGANTSNGSNVPVSILNGTVQIGAISLNQRLAPDDLFDDGIWWENAGTYIVDSTLQIQMSDNSNGYAIADAFRIERMISASPVALEDIAYYTPNGTNLIVSTSSTPPSLLANDIGFDSPNVWAKVVTYPANGRLIAFGTNGTFTYQPNLGFTGVDSFTYRTSNGVLESQPSRVSIAVGTRLLGRQNLDSNVFNPWSDDPWLATSLLDATTHSEGFGQGASNVPTGSSAETEGGITATGGLQLVEDVAPNTAIVYRSNSLTKPIVSVHTQLAPGVAVPTAITARLIFNGVAGITYSYSTANVPAGQAMRFALQADGTSLPTGMYDYTIEVTTTVSGVALTQSFPGKQAIVNRSASEFGFGWGLDGLDRLFDSTLGALVVRGNGYSLWFPKTGTSYQHALGDTSYSALVKNGNGTFTLTSKTGIVSGFSSLGLLSSRVDANNNSIAYAYADRNSDGIVAELISITDPYGRITNFTYTSSKVTGIAHYSGRTTTLSYSATLVLVAT